MITRKASLPFILLFQCVFSHNLRSTSLKKKHTLSEKKILETFEAVIVTEKTFEAVVVVELSVQEFYFFFLRAATGLVLITFYVKHHCSYAKFFAAEPELILKFVGTLCDRKSC